jgi:hypothetical protein
MKIRSLVVGAMSLAVLTLTAIAAEKEVKLDGVMCVMVAKNPAKAELQRR